MQAAEIMTRSVVTATPRTEIKAIVELMMLNRISAVPVVDADQRVIGMVSEGDLMRRTENETEKRDSWWLKSLFSGRDDAQTYIKSHGQRAEDVMTREPIVIAEDTPLYKIAQTLEKHHIKRVPVVRDGKLVGIVSRANLLQGFAATHTVEEKAGTADDESIRNAILHELQDKVKMHGATINVVVYGGEVQLWGLVETGAEKKAAEVAAETTPGVKHVTNHLGIAPAVIGPY